MISMFTVVVVLQETWDPASEEPGGSSRVQKKEEGVHQVPREQVDNWYWCCSCSSCCWCYFCCCCCPRPVLHILFRFEIVGASGGIGKRWKLILFCWWLSVLNFDVQSGSTWESKQGPYRGTEVLEGTLYRYIMSGLTQVKFNIYLFGES